MAEPIAHPADAQGRESREPIVARLIAGVLAAEVLAAGTTALLIAASGRRDWWSGWTAALVVSLLAAALAIGPVIIGVRGGVQTAAYGYLAGAMLRMLASLGGGMVAVLIARTPPLPTLMLIVPLYMAQLVAECVVLGRAVWTRTQS